MDGLILFLSKMILIVPSVDAALLTVAVVGLYIFDVFVLPIKSVDVLVAWHFPTYTKYALVMLSSFIADVVNSGLGMFLTITYASNYSSILHFFITDSIGKLKQ